MMSLRSTFCRILCTDRILLLSAEPPHADINQIKLNVTKQTLKNSSIKPQQTRADLPILPISKTTLRDHIDDFLRKKFSPNTI